MTTVRRLSNYQKKVLDEAKKEIDKARNCKSIYEYFTEVNYFHDRIINSINNNPEYLQMYINEWNDKKNAIVNVNSNIKTIQKLEQLGYIKVVEICDNRSNIVIDTIQVLNY
jgi:hypothetical protein